MRDLLVHSLKNVLIALFCTSKQHYIPNVALELYLYVTLLPKDKWMNRNTDVVPRFVLPRIVD